LTFLPIHAAGIYDGSDQGCVSDYIVSSYTPTVAALLRADQSGAKVSFKMTAMIQPYSDSSPLPGTLDELKAIRARVPPEWLISLGESTRATTETAVGHLRNSSIVHFACHGVQDVINPLDSGLVLTDGVLKVSKLMRDLDGEWKNGPALAFLSACETAKGDENVPDEALHLSATLLFAGFGGVIGTMW
jgi:CHAT domain-containing protein